MIIETCITEIQRNVTLTNITTTNENGEEVNLQQELLSSLCPSDCNDHGQCVNGMPYC